MELSCIHQLKWKKCVIFCLVFHPLQDDPVFLCFERRPRFSKIQSELWWGFWGFQSCRFLCIVHTENLWICAGFERFSIARGLPYSKYPCLAFCKQLVLTLHCVFGVDSPEATPESTIAWQLEKSNFEFVSHKSVNLSLKTQQNTDR